MERLSPIYWPFDLIKDVSAIAKVHKDEDLVLRAEQRMKHVLPPMKWSGGSIAPSQLRRDLGIPASMVPMLSTDISMVSYEVARYNARMWYGSSFEFYRFFATTMFEPSERELGAKIMASMPYMKLCQMTEEQLVAHVRSLQTLKN
jgi:hypothetical protein